MVNKKRANKKKSSVKKKNKLNPVSKTDFEAFKFGIQRLKELGKELDYLDTRGFSKEEQDIKARLKEVSEIPIIEGKIRDLKLKINNKFKPKKRKKSVSKDIQDELKKIEKAHEKDSEFIKKSAVKQRIPIDAGVGILVDTNFNDFLKETKIAISERIRAREKEVSDILEADLQKRENNFKQKHLNLIREFNARKRKLDREFEKKYQIKVKSSLHKEISEKFNETLQKKLNAEKIELGKRYIAELKEKADRKLVMGEEKLKERLKGELEKKTNELTIQFNKEEAGLEKERQKLIDRKKGLEQTKQRVMDRIKDDLEHKRKLLQLNLDKEKSQILNREKNLGKLKESIQQRAIAEQKKLISQLKREQESLQKDKQRFVLQKAEERKEMKEKISETAHKQLEKDLKMEEKKIRGQLQNEFELKLKKEIQQHEGEIKRKKLDLELEMQKKIKQVLA